MEREAEEHLEQILKQAGKTFAEIEVLRHDISEERALLKLKGKLGVRDVFVTEILTPQTRWYSYYLLERGYVLIGLDNYSDREALRLKYGRGFTRHLQEPIPHLHTENKRKLELTEEKSFADFVQMLQELGDK